MRGLISWGLFIILLSATPLFAEQAGNFSFHSIDGKSYTAVGLKGTPLVVNIGSHW
jgi:hypothetical protein